jgi:predicted esterase
MNFKKVSILLTGILLLFSANAAAKQIPREIQKKILSKSPNLDKDGDKKLTVKEYMEGRTSIPRKLRNRFNSALEVEIEDFKGEKARKVIIEMGLRLEQGIKYKESKQGRTLLDIVYPKSNIYKKAPVLVFVHGGGYQAGSRTLLYENSMKLGIVKHVTSQGIAVAAIGYRLIGKDKHTRMVHLNQDIKDALRYLAKNSDQFRIDPDKFIVWGQSAGGSLALVAGFTPSDHLPGAVSGPGTKHTVIGCINFFGLTTFIEPSVVGPRNKQQSKTIRRWFDLEGGLDTEQTIIDCSPDKHLKKKSPSLLQFSGEKDDKVSVKHGRYVNKLGKKVGADVNKECRAWYKS